MSETNQVEVDMGTVQRVFAYASDTIVEASRLRQDFAQLRVEVDGLRDELSRLRRQNEFMDEQLVNVRRSRDEAHGKIHELEGTLHERHVHIQELEARNKNLQFDLDTTKNELGNARKERDDAQLHVMELEEANAKLAKQVEDVKSQWQEMVMRLSSSLGVPSARFGEQLKEEQPKPVQEPPTLPGPDERQPGETEEEHKLRTQPRDPVTQQWRSPYGNIGDEPPAPTPEDWKVA